MPRANSLRRLSVALGFGKPVNKDEEKLQEVKEEKPAVVEEPAAEPAAEPAPAEAAAAAPADTTTTEPVVEAQVKEAATAPIPGTGALSQFLTLSKQKYLNDIRANPPRGAQWTVAMGNEAGDLDSLVSAIAFAFYNSTKSTGSGTTPTIPLYQVASPDFKLRPENIYALSLGGITSEAAPETLFTLSDLPSPLSPLSFPSTQFALVDHNRLGASFSVTPDTANVTSVIDHHADEGFYKEASPRLIAPCGSCASHVTTLFFPPSVELPPELATLLLTAILIDTDGLKVGGKATLEDVRAVLFLVSRSTLSFTTAGNQLLENAEEILAKATTPAVAATAPVAATGGEGAAAPGGGEGAAKPAPAAPAAEKEEEKKDEKKEEKKDEKKEKEKDQKKKDEDGWVKVQEALSEVPALKSLAEELASKKADVTELSIRDLLRRDYKEYEYTTPYVVDPKQGEKKAKAKKEKAKAVVEKKSEKKVEGKKDGEAPAEGEAPAAEATTAPAAPSTPPPQAPTPPPTATLKAGLASVPISLSSIASKGQLEQSLIEWMHERSLTILGILSSFHTPQKDWDRKEKKKGKGKHRREMLWVVLDPTPSPPPSSNGAGASNGAGVTSARATFDSPDLSAPVPVDAAGLSTTPPPPTFLISYKTLSKHLFSGLKSNKEIEPKKSKAVKVSKKKLPVGKDTFVKVKVYEQGNVKANRKVTAPVLKALVEGA